MRKYRGSFYAIFIIFGIRTTLEYIIRPFYFKKIIDTLSENVTNKADLSHGLLILVVTIIFISLLTTITARVCKFIFFAFEINVIKELRNFSLKKIQYHSQTFFANTFSGSLVTKSRRFVGSFETMFDILLFNFWSTFIVLVGVFIVLGKTSVIISFFFLIWVLIYFSIIAFFLRRKIKYDVIEAASDSSISGRLADIFGNILAVKIFSATKSETNSFKEITEDASIKSRKAWFLAGKIEVIQAVLAFIVQGSLLYVMVHLWLNNKITTGTIVLVQGFIVVIFDKLWDFGNSLTKFMKAGADMKEMIDIFEIKSDIEDPINPEVLKMQKGNLQFSDVSFDYGNNTEIFSNFTLDIPHGQRIGIVGHSGAGKSTITNLILRFMDVTKGSITIDDQDIRNVLQDDLRSMISYVPQESVLFHRTIRENIAYGKPDATEEEIIEVAKKAHAHDFISKLPKGYETFVGERGVKLSGGERQRVAIARAMLKNAPILLLDEATSALDSVSESYIQEALVELMKDKTVIVIAHRLSTIQKMDRIIVLENGTIVEDGNHKQLLKKKGVYADLWAHQSGGFIE